MPEQLGERVHAELDRRDQVAPVIATPASENWTFLTASARPEDWPVSPCDPLFPLRAKRMLQGSVITLPSPWPWVVEPEGRQRPPLQLLTEITIVAARSQR